MTKEIKHILVIRLSALGDVAMMVPVLRVFIEQFPDVKLTVLTRPFFKPLFRDLNNVAVYEAHVNGEHKGVFGLLQLARQLKGNDIDAVADCHNVLRSNILKYALRIKPFAQIDKGRKAKKDLVSGKRFEPLISTHQRYADVFEALGFKIDLSTPIFPAKSNLDLNTLPIISNQLKRIGIAPFAAFPAKAYPIVHMELVIKELSQHYQLILFGGGQKEIESMKQLEDKYENTIYVSGRISFNDELNLISNLDLMISMDSGNAHIAAMYGIETLTIWGVTHPYAGFYPFYQDSNNALLADRNKFPKIPTSVYGKDYPKGYEKAISTISHNDIIQKARSILKTDQTSS